MKNSCSSCNVDIHHKTDESVLSFALAINHRNNYLLHKQRQTHFSLKNTFGHKHENAPQMQRTLSKIFW
jgi:pantothenate synthetase